jgi:methionyl-tRNA formyltransferase
MQDERAATYAPLIRQGVSMVPFDQWQVERVHHFLAALCPRFREPLVDGNGRMILYDRVMEYRSGPTDRLPGSVEKCQHGWTLHCRDGVLLLGEGSH